MSEAEEDPSIEDDTEVDRYGFYPGDQFTCPKMFTPIQLAQLRLRENKWLEILSNWDCWMSRNAHRIRNRCRKGIPPALRPRVWQYLCGSHTLVQKNPGEYQKILASVVPENLINQIKLDIHRQFPNHLMFANLNGIGQQALFNVLKAYCSIRPETGYCQAHAPIASAMLIHMPEEEAFWTLLSICDQYMQNYFNSDLIRVRIEMNSFMSLLKKYRPEISKHLVTHAVEPMCFATDWFMCLLTRNLPWATVLRILDMFFFEGIKVIFRTALAIMDLLLGTRHSREKLNSMDSIMNALRRLPNEITTEEILIPRSLCFKQVTASKLAAEYKRNYPLISS